MPRDDFDLSTKQVLANRVGNKCANPNCRRLTSGPQVDPTKAINIGVAAHVTAAAPGGPRYDETLTQEERKSAHNGIWLCQACAKLIDNDSLQYSVDLLHQWRRLSEQAAALEMESLSTTPNQDYVDDVELIRFYAQCLDRPAFQDRFSVQGSMVAFAQALNDSILALNTGLLRTRDGQVIARSKGKVYLKNPQWRQRMDVIVDGLSAIRSRYYLAVESGEIHLRESNTDRQWFSSQSRELMEWMNLSRADILNTFNEICTQAQIPSLRSDRLTRHF